MTRISAKTAIERSVSHNEIVTLEASEALEMALSQLCDDSVSYPGEDGTTVREYWGKTDDGDDWRVHVVYECEEQAAADLGDG